MSHWRTPHCELNVPHCFPTSHHSEAGGANGGLYPSEDRGDTWAMSFLKLNSGTIRLWRRWRETVAQSCKLSPPASEMHLFLLFPYLQNHLCRHLCNSGMIILNPGVIVEINLCLMKGLICILKLLLYMFFFVVFCFFVFIANKWRVSTVSDAASLPAMGQILVSHSPPQRHIIKNTSITTDISVFSIIIIL